MVVRVRSRRRTPGAVQDPLFEVRLQPERRYYRQILQALTRAAFTADPLLAELTISKVLGVIWASDPGRDGSAEEAFGLGLVEYAGQSRTPTSVALLRTLATVGTLREVRDAASAAADLLILDGLPPFSFATLQRGRCWAYEDAFGDLTTLICEYGYGDALKTAERHGLIVQVDHVSFSAAIDAELVDDVDGAVQDLQFGSAHETHTVRLVEAGWAGAMLSRAFARTDLIPTVIVEPTFAENRAIAMSRVAALPSMLLPTEPEPTPARRDAVVAEFLRTGGALPGAEAVARLIVEFAASHDPGDLVRVSPGRWETFLFEWLPRSSGPVPPEEIAAVVRAWSAWAVHTNPLSEPARDHMARLLDQLLEEFIAA